MEAINIFSILPLDKARSICWLVVGETPTTGAKYKTVVNNHGVKINLLIKIKLNYRR